MSGQVVNLLDHLALVCSRCGAVQFSLLKSGGIECAQCFEPVKGEWKVNEKGGCN